MFKVSNEEYHKDDVNHSVREDNCGEGTKGERRSQPQDKMPVTKESCQNLSLSAYLMQKESQKFSLWLICVLSPRK